MHRQAIDICVNLVGARRIVGEPVGEILESIRKADTDFDAVATGLLSKKGRPRRWARCPISWFERSR
jgi:hypothetical protein